MKKTRLLIIIAIAVFGYLTFYSYKGFRKQQKKNEEIICYCQKKGTNVSLTLSSNKKIEIFFNTKRINYIQHPIDKGFLNTLELFLEKSSQDTLFIKENTEITKIYDFKVDTLIVNEKQGITCDLKEFTMNGKKQNYEVGEIINID